jgi:tetratricopeptide (TPR) repeat protein
MQVVNLSCPGCGGGVSTADKECKFCGRPVVITSFSSAQTLSPLELNKYASAYRKALAENPENQDLNMSVAMCYLRLRLYDQAIPAFEKAITDNFDNSESFFYAAIALLKGKKAFLAPGSDVRKAIEYLNAAIMIEPRGIYHYFLAYLKYDYFERKYLNISPNWQEHKTEAMVAGVSGSDIAQLSETLQVEEMPTCLIV